MPTNLPAEAQAKLAKYQEARTVEEKIRALEEALPLIPDHKGTEKMRAQLKTTLAKLRKEAERKKSAKVSRTDLFAFKKEGAATVALLGVANSGKSTIIRFMTNAKAEVSMYELTTTRPIPAMMLYEDVYIQLVELPAVLTSKLETTPFTSRSIAAARGADLILLTLDGMRSLEEQYLRLVELLEDSGITLGAKSFEVDVEKKDSGGIRIVLFGRFHGSLEELKRELQQIGLRNAVVKIYGEADVDGVLEQVLHPTVYKKAMVAVGRSDYASAAEVEKLRKLTSQHGLPLVQLTETKPETFRELAEKIFQNLELVRIYTQKDGVVNRKPVVVKKGTTVKELAQIIHREIAEELKYARVWGRSVKIQGQQVGPSHVLMDGDTVELVV
ncbi:MAG: TGS domain-containing protein [Candidatus Caldarchaeum sp.]|uniref:TGS domain-containing protein n=1 Tax=Caldiarchaeum subterraneum TaxID=311458 RepID=A0A7C4I4S1_CALS0|nr:TGS domain-containing protein [Candidatus Caldarchaeales archaeon]